MEKFLKPEMEVVVFDNEDVMTTSPCGDATVNSPGMPSGDADGCGFGPCGANDAFFRGIP